MRADSLGTATPRQLAAVLAGGCGAALAGGMVVQYGLGHPPCSLCVLQRLAYIAVLLIALAIAALPLPRYALRALAVLAVTAAGAGLAVAAYQVGLNAFSIEVARCGRGPAGYFEDTPLEAIANWLLDAGGDCGSPVRILGALTMPQAGLAGFVLAVPLSLRIAWLSMRGPAREPGR